MASVSWMDVLSETKDTAPPLIPAQTPSSPAASQQSNLNRGSGGRSSSSMLSCISPPMAEDDEFGSSRKPQSPPRKLSRRSGDDDAGSGSERSNESPKHRHSVKPSFFINTDQPTLGDPPLWQAANDGDVIAFKQHLDAESVRYQNKHKDTLLHLSVIRGRNDIIRLLLPSSGLPLVPIDAQNLYGETPLHRACSTGNAAIAQLLIERGANVNTPNVYGETPFYAAAYAGHSTIIEFLLTVRGIRYRESGDENMRPINLARNRRHTEVVRAILRHDRWRAQRVLWLAQKKNPSSPFSSLNDSIIRNIVRFVQPPLSKQLSG